MNYLTDNINLIITDTKVEIETEVDVPKNEPLNGQHKPNCAYLATNSYYKY